MLTLSLDSISGQCGDWDRAGIDLPRYDEVAMRRRTLQNPRWLHFGAGNIFRGFIASLAEQLLNGGYTDTGIIAAETFDKEIIKSIYAPYDNLALNVILYADGSSRRGINACIADCLWAPDNLKRLREIAQNQTLEVISLTITEKGYQVRDGSGGLTAPVLADINAGPDSPQNVMSIVCSLLYSRYLSGAYPVTVLSLDNCSQNGKKLQSAVMDIADGWCGRGHVPAEFLRYLSDSVAFPWSMIDKITPRPAQSVAQRLLDDGIGGMDITVTDKGTHIAPFVNAEGPQYLVVEEHFLNGRPPLEHAGVMFADRDTVMKVETMKVTTCLNPLHTALAVYGCLLGYRSIAAEMQDPLLVSLIERIGYTEGMPVVTDPGIIDPRAFIGEVINERFKNPNIPDTPQRIATDTSQKIPVRYGETLKAYRDRGLSIKDLVGIPLAIAGWLRYLVGVDDEMVSMEPSPDPMLPKLKEMLAGVTAGEPETLGRRIDPLLADSSLFGINLMESGLGDTVYDMLRSMLKGKGAVRETLKNYLKQ